MIEIFIEIYFKFNCGLSMILNFSVPSLFQSIFKILKKMTEKFGFLRNYEENHTCWCNCIWGQGKSVKKMDIAFMEILVNAMFSGKYFS